MPSLRADNFSRELMEKLQTVRKSGLTFAPEAGTQRLRDVINKNLTEEEILNTCTQAFSGGWNNVKLYFMLGLPTETSGDDSLAMSLTHLTGIPIQRLYLISDLIVLLLSLSYIPLRRIGYSLLTVILSGQIIGWMQKKKSKGIPATLKTSY